MNPQGDVERVASKHASSKQKHGKIRAFAKNFCKVKIQKIGLLFCHIFEKKWPHLSQEISTEDYKLLPKHLISTAKYSAFLKKVSKMGPMSSIRGTSGVKTPNYSGDTKRNEERGIWWKRGALEGKHMTVMCCREGVMKSHYLPIWTLRGVINVTDWDL